VDHVVGGLDLPSAEAPSAALGEPPPVSRDAVDGAAFVERTGIEDPDLLDALVAGMVESVRRQLDEAAALVAQNGMHPLAGLAEEMAGAARACNADGLHAAASGLAAAAAGGDSAASGVALAACRRQHARVAAWLADRGRVEAADARR
jgi:hypothetical protein